MSKYAVLLNILDRLRDESNGTRYTGLYAPSAFDADRMNQARSRAFIHLFLKVSFGLLSFEERERLVTDGGFDGGIDGYYIHKENKTVYFIQSKFRTTEANFENKDISLDEILVMDIDRILKGEDRDLRGNEYNGKIKGMMREIGAIEDIARYRYQVIILANLSKTQPDQLRRLTGGYSTEVFDYSECYKKLVFPVISGTYFNAADLSIYIDLSNKNAGSKISYTVTTKTSECEITVLFVPTIEVAKVLHRYKNSILKYNPRSYLELEGRKINEAIRDTIVNMTTNEFALFNNGITMLSDETYINERIGQKNKAQLTVRNPQIINGGQTAYTLSRLYEEIDPQGLERVFEGKEVLLKVITLMSSGQKIDFEGKLALIEQISAATNQQTPVSTADRHSNENIFLQIQQTLFDRYGLLYERKRGEFADGLHKKYIMQHEVLERNLFFRVFLASNGSLRKAMEKKLFLKFSTPEDFIANSAQLDNFYFGYLAFRRFVRADKQTDHFQQRHFETFGKVYAITHKYRPSRVTEFENVLKQHIGDFDKEWKQFIRSIEGAGQKYIKRITDRKTGEERIVFNRYQWLRSDGFKEDIEKYFRLLDPRTIASDQAISSLVPDPGSSGVAASGGGSMLPQPQSQGPTSSLAASASRELKGNWISRIFRNRNKAD